MTHGGARLDARDLTVAYPGRAPALSAVTLSVAAGELVAVLGPNGAGKSTLVRALSGVMPATSGHVALDGVPITSLSRREIARKVAVVPQLIDVSFGFRVREVVAMGRAPHQGTLLAETAEDRRRVDEVLAACDLSGLADRRVDELSGGEQRLCAIARAFAQEASTLLLDEPAAHLDIRHAYDVYELLRAQVEEKKLACLVVMHDLNAAAQYAHRIVLTAHGRVVAAGPVDEVMTYRTLRDVFGAELYVGVNELDGTRYFIPMRKRPSRESDAGKHPTDAGDVPR
jgi:iron complex transport system ATP-binding protein